MNSMAAGFLCVFFITVLHPRPHPPHPTAGHLCETLTVPRVPRGTLHQWWNWRVSCRNCPQRASETGKQGYDSVRARPHPLLPPSLTPAAANATAAKALQSCPTLCDPIDGSPPGSPISEILQARTLEWVAISFSNAWKWKVKVKPLSRVWLLVTPWTAAYQAPPMGFQIVGLPVGHLGK